MAYGANLNFAERALLYVKEKMTIGAANNVDAITSLGTSLLCVVAQRSVDFGISNNSGIPSDILKAAAKAEHLGCGNCGEQAAIAFVYLSEELKVRPLDFMSRTNADHAFVIIGRKESSDDTDYMTWGQDCIVCDPWDSKFYPAVEIPIKAYKAHAFAAESIYRRAN